MLTELKAGVLHTKLSIVPVSLEKDLVDDHHVGVAFIFNFIYWGFLIFKK